MTDDPLVRWWERHHHLTITDMEWGHESPTFFAWTMDGYRCAIASQGRAPDDYDGQITAVVIPATPPKTPAVYARNNALWSVYDTTPRCLARTDFQYGRTALVFTVAATHEYSAASRAASDLYLTPFPEIIDIVARLTGQPSERCATVSRI